MNTKIALISLMLVVVGLWHLLSSGEGAWRTYERRMRARGIVNLERTPEWDRSRTWGDGAIVALGILMFLLFTALGHSSGRSGIRANPPSGAVWFDENGKEIPPDEAHRMGLPDK